MREGGGETRGKGGGFRVIGKRERYEKKGGGITGDEEEMKWE